MRVLPTLFASLFSVAVLGVSASALADEDHSLCVPGGPLPYPSVSPDPVKAGIINYVCGTPSFSQFLAHCCVDGPGGRWDLECVQEAARYAKEQGLGDMCGRDAWAQGVIVSTPQRYPRDFSMFSLGNTNGLPDSDGPVAARGNIALSSFNLNAVAKQPVALVALGGLTLTSGQITGQAHYGTFYNAQNVNFISASPPVAPSQPIDFNVATPRLQEMSQAIKSYTAVPATKEYGTVTFQGSDPELNVFSIDASQLGGTGYCVFDVPQNSSVIVNVTGAAPTIQSAGFDRRNGLAAERILWNFPDATRLRLSSVSLPGSVLAPSADAGFTYGSLLGTAVVKSSVGTASFALRGATFEMPQFCGTPDFDPTIWNASGSLEKNNCYNYANNVYLSHYGQPGRASGDSCSSVLPPCSTAANIARQSTNDGLLPTTATATCPKQMTKIALFFQAFMDFGYHWWRQDSDGTWSAKNGPLPAEKTNMTPDQVSGETKLVGYFCTCSSRIQGHGSAVIE